MPAVHWVFQGVKKVKEKLEAANSRFLQESYINSFEIDQIAKDLGSIEDTAAADTWKWLSFATGMIGTVGGAPVSSGIGMERDGIWDMT